MIQYNIAHVVGRFIFDRPVRSRSFAELAEMLEQSGQKLDERLATASDSYANYDCLAHIIGIERWSQRRLRTLLGEPVLRDEYDTYRPAISLFWDDLRAAFASTRQETIALVRQLEQAGKDESDGVAHNELGILSAKGWIRYLDMHANLESKGMK